MNNLAHLAFKSEDTFGRAVPREQDRDRDLYWMDPYSLDLMKIQYSKAIRRLRGKTQVISGVKNIHIRDRMIHSMEVSTLAVQIATRLGLNVPLVQASALGHDLGHVVYGHLGEQFITERLGEYFRHEKFVIFILEMIERDGKGLNLSYETLHAIRNHSRGKSRMVTNGSTLEDDDVMYSDKLSYVFSDYNDIKKRSKLEGLHVPDEMYKLGTNQAERVFTCARALCDESLQKGKISFEDSLEAEYFKVVRDFMYEDVYGRLDRQIWRDRLNRVYDLLLRYYKSDRIASLFMALMAEEGFAIMDEMVGKFGDNFIMEKLHDTAIFSIAEFLPKIPEWAELDFCNSDNFLLKENFGKIPKELCFKKAA